MDHPGFYRRTFCTFVLTGPTFAVLVLFFAGVDCWRWGSVSSCPPGPEPVCPENPVNDSSNYFPHPTDCHYYVHCDGSRRPICRRCSPTTYFNPHTFNCVWPLQASCEHNATTRQESLLPPICGPDRECYEEGATEKDYVNCARYYVCRNGTKVREECPSGLAYIEKLGQCGDPDETDCDHGEIEPTVRCEVEGMAVKIDCRTYTICHEGTTQIYSCKSDQYFDEVSKTCLQGSCQRPNCEDKEDPTDCNYYYKNCDLRTKCPENKHFNKKTKHCENQCTAGCKNPSDIPQCRECQEEGKILKYDCHSYSICRGGKIVSQLCRNDQYFDPITGTCTTGSCNPTPPPPTPPPTCEDREDPNDCNFYYTKCNQRVRCLNGQHFNKLTKVCENPCTAGCQNPNDIPQCRECQEEGKILKYDCHSYSICRGGKIVSQFCRNDQYFDPITGTCTTGSCNPTPPPPTPPPTCEDREDPNDCNFYYTKCNQRVRCLNGQHFNKLTKVCENPCTAGCQNPNDIPQCRECQEEGKILKYDCHSYSICRGGKIVSQLCRNDQYFDPITGTCTTGSCNPTPPPPTPPPTCEDREDPNDCNFYYTKCNQRVRCLNGQHFNKVTKVCENPCSAGCQNPSDIPQCRQCLEEGKILKYDCHSYSICRGGKIVSQLCRNDQYFDPITGTCTIGSCNPTPPPPTPPPTCEDREDPNDCNFYYTKCNQRVRCLNGQHFNKLTKVCENPCTAGCQNPNDIPQCRECQEEGKILKYDCHSYSICRGGKIISQLCRNDQYFDPITGTCTIGSCNPTPPPPTPPPTCEDREDPNDCNFYYTKCNQRVRCLNGQHFNKLTKVCENPCTAGCQNPSDIPQCKECQEEGKILKYDCHSYSICRGGKIVSQLCRNDQYFDPITGTCTIGSCNPTPPPPTPPPTCEDREDPKDCNYYYKNCDQRVKCPLGQHFNRERKQCENQCTANCLDPKSIPGCHRCAPEGKTFEDPCSCEMYYKCENGVKVLAMCESGLHYNNTIGVCDVPCSDTCPKLFARKPECCASTKGKPEPQCPTTVYSIFLPHPSDSRWFYQCLQGVLYCNRCPPGHRWNIDEDTCDNSCQCP
ncbi:balbiani ring protein 3-like [Periplaneta americana]|uniref:balbiani ring protein 3-like n=1 Tax=Periplaneta americana TaxID=6978 RepID=UPI0037E94240